MTREEIIEALVNNDIDTVIRHGNVGDHSYIYDIFMSGFKGYDYFTDKELIDEYYEVFEGSRS